MNAKQTMPLTVEAVEMLLQKRTADNASRYHEEMQSLAEVISGVADPDTIAKVDRHLTTCDDCRKLLTVLYWAESNEADEAAKPVPMVRPAREPKRLWRPLSLAAAAVLLFALSFVLLNSEDKQIAPEDRFVPKGNEDNLIVAVQRGDTLFTPSHLDQLKRGDSLGLFYTASTPGYLAVLNRDGSGGTSVLFPMNADSSAAIQAGEKVSLPDGAVVEDGQNCEWIIAVFSEKPMPLSALRQAVETARETETKCGLALQIPDARAKTVLSFTR